MMTTQALDPDQHNAIAIVPSFENVHGILVDLHVYLFDDEGTLLAQQPVQKGRAMIASRDAIKRCAHIVLAPPVDAPSDEPLTLAGIRAFHAFAIDYQILTGLSVQALPPVPESVWRWWLVHSLWKSLKIRTDPQPATFPA